MTSEKVSDLPTLWVYGPSLTQAMATPADRVARVSAFLRRDHDESREYEFVPAARLEEANLEIARLTLAAQNAREILQAFTPTCAQAPSHREMRRAALAALTPKEPSDV